MALDNYHPGAYSIFGAFYMGNKKHTKEHRGFTVFSDSFIYSNFCWIVHFTNDAKIFPFPISYIQHDIVFNISGIPINYYTGLDIPVLIGKNAFQAIREELKEKEGQFNEIWV